MAKSGKLLLGTFAFALILAILWLATSESPLQPPVGLNISKVERTTGTNGSVGCSFTLANVSNRRVVVRAMLERRSGPREWLPVPSSRPGPMYATDLLLIKPGQTNSVFFPTPTNDLIAVAYRVGVDYWPCKPASAVWVHNVRSMLWKVLGRKAPSTGVVIIGGLAGQRGTAIYWPARARIETGVWNAVQPGAVDPDARGTQFREPPWGRYR